MASTAVQRAFFPKGAARGVTMNGKSVRIAIIEFRLTTAEQPADQDRK
jgi:hypothetical protein